MAEHLKKRSPLRWRVQGTTTFYPQYGNGRDSVVAIVPTRPTQFQMVVPRYRLSASETRDQGVGPFLEEVAYRPSAHHPTPMQGTPKIDSPPKPVPRKIRIDFMF